MKRYCEGCVLMNGKFTCVVLSILSGVLARGSGLVVQGPSGSLELLQFRVRSASTIETALSLGTLPTGGRVLTAKDFDGNGSVDLVLEYDPDGAGPRPAGTFLWRFSGETRIDVIQLGGVATGYSVPVGVCDLDGDGNFELMMWNPSNKSVRTVEILKAAPYAGGERTILVGGRDAFSQVIAVGDMDSDGHDDEILQDPTTKNLRIRYLNGTQGLSISATLIDGPPPARLAGFVSFQAPSPGRPGGLGFILESVDGVEPRHFWFMSNQNLSSVYDVTGDDAYRSWPIVAVVP